MLPTTKPEVFSEQNLAAQKTLAKLLSEENITVTVGNYSTAYFDCTNRVLGLPTWSFADENMTASAAKGVIDLMTGHEVGHALETPEDGVERFKARFAGTGIPFSTCNIIEDIRIERMALDRYPGLLHSFTVGYKYFIDTDKFEIEGKDPASLGFMDRLNIRSKTRRTDLVPLSEEEEAFYQECYAAETYDEVLDLVEKAAEMVKNNPKPKPQDSEEGEGDPGDGGACESDEEQQAGPNDDTSQNNPEAGDGEEDCESAGGEDAKAADSSEQSDEEASSYRRTPSNGAGNEEIDEDLYDELHAETQDALERNLEDMQHDYGDAIPVVTPSRDYLRSTIVPVETIREARKELKYGRDRYTEIMTNEEGLEKWNSFKAASKKQANLLAKEFERRKAAYQYARATESRTGQLNVNKLHNYKFDDQIFKSVTQLADSKSHGMIMLIDYSGSMSGSIKAVVEQTIQLVMFCKAVNIPFEVYAFTSVACGATQNELRGQYYGTIPGDHIDLSHTQLRQLVTSEMKKRDYEDALRELWSTHAYCRFGTKYEEMYSTPLNESLLVMHTIVEDFQKKHRIQKTNLIILTDGDGSGVSFDTLNRKETAPFSKEKDANGYRGWKCDLRVTWKGQSISIQGEVGYQALIHNLKRCYGVKVIGFFLTDTNKWRSSNHIERGLRTMTNYDAQGNETKKGFDSIRDCTFENAVTKARKNKVKFYSFPGWMGYDDYYVLPGKRAIQIEDGDYLSNVDDNLDLGAAKNRGALARAFSKQTGSSRHSRIFLGTFAEAIS